MSLQGGYGQRNNNVGCAVGRKVCAHCIAAQIQDQFGALAVPNRLMAEQTASRLSLSTPMPTQPRQELPR
jgi:hypothetical protein